MSATIDRILALIRTRRNTDDILNGLNFFEADLVYLGDPVPKTCRRL